MERRRWWLLAAPRVSSTPGRRRRSV
uniref:Fad7 n=1 Tax=Arundo donax TaxID=35708 RepID=A0A0A9DYC0_ARUDO